MEIHWALPRMLGSCYSAMPTGPPNRLPIACVFDVDGTLYHAPALRRMMAMRIAREFLRRPVATARVVRVVQAYREAHERLRNREERTDLALHQLQLTAGQCGVNIERAKECVARWMAEEPLQFMARCRREGLEDFLGWLQASGIRMGVLSDYPAREKLKALGVDRFFGSVVSAQDADVQCVKPNTAGLEKVLRELKTEPGSTIYIGDRIDVDVALAKAAGMRCVVLGAHTRRHEDWMEATSFVELRSVLEAA